MCLCARHVYSICLAYGQHPQPYSPLVNQVKTKGLVKKNALLNNKGMNRVIPSNHARLVEISKEL